MARFELVIASVLLDAGAGERWSYQAPSGARYARSEGLAVASYDWFAAGRARFREARSRHPRRPCRSVPGHAEDNPLDRRRRARSVVERARPSRQLESALLREQRPRLGGLSLFLLGHARDGERPPLKCCRRCCSALGAIWPGRETLHGENLGDVWTHPAVGKVPFHKLSQWLSYSLCEPLEAAGLTVTGLSELTGLAEYRNGGLFVDGGVLVPKRPRCSARRTASAPPWSSSGARSPSRLLDRTAERLRARLGLSPEQLPLARVLEGGTWRAGRALANERRPGGTPPLSVISDGTVF